MSQLLYATLTLSQAVEPATTKPETEPVVAWGAVLLLVGIALIGLILIVAVIAYGGRLRSFARRELPAVEEPDPYAAMRAETRRNRRGRDDTEDELL